MTLCTPCWNYEKARAIHTIEYNPSLEDGETCGRCGADSQEELETMDIITERDCGEYQEDDNSATDFVERHSVSTLNDSEKRNREVELSVDGSYVGDVKELELEVDADQLDRERSFSFKQGEREYSGSFEFDISEMNPEDAFGLGLMLAGGNDE